MIYYDPRRWMKREKKNCLIEFSIRFVWFCSISNCGSTAKNVMCHENIYHSDHSTHLKHYVFIIIVLWRGMEVQKSSKRSPSGKMSGEGFHVETDHTRGEERNRFGTITKCCLFLCSFWCYMQLYDRWRHIVCGCNFFSLHCMLYIYSYMDLTRNEIYLSIIKVKDLCM